MIFTVARFLLDGPVLPIVTETLPLAESLRAALMSRFRRAVLGRHFPRGVPNDPPLVSPSPIFSGKLHGEHRRDHDHAYYLPTDEDHDGRIDHLTVFAAAGFGPDEVAALDALRRLRFGAGEPLRLLLVGLGQPRNFTANLFGRAPVWQSATPYVAWRHCKTRGQKKDPPEMRRPGMEGEFCRILLAEDLDRLRQRCRDLAQVAKIDVMPLEGPERPRVRPLQYQRTRRKAGDDGGRRQWGIFRVTFKGPVAGPLCLGHASHFGLGLFLPVLADSPQSEPEREVGELAVNGISTQRPLGFSGRSGTGR